MKPLIREPEQRPEGITLQPGEEATFAVNLPPDIEEAVRNGATIDAKQGPVIADGDGHFHKIITITVDGFEPIQAEISWLEL